VAESRGTAHPYTHDPHRVHFGVCSFCTSHGSLCFHLDTGFHTGGGD
jgi:hypothetical protein